MFSPQFTHSLCRLPAIFFLFVFFKIFSQTFGCSFVHVFPRPCFFTLSSENWHLFSDFSRPSQGADSARGAREVPQAGRAGGGRTGRRARPPLSRLFFFCQLPCRHCYHCYCCHWWKWQWQCGWQCWRRSRSRIDAGGGSVSGRSVPHAQARADQMRGAIIATNSSEYVNRHLFSTHKANLFGVVL